MKHILKYILLLIAFLLAMFFILVALFSFKTKYAKREIETLPSPDGRYELCIYEIGEPDWPFGPTNCRFVLKEGNHKIVKHSFLIFNDGKTAEEDNFKVTWDENSVKIQVTGEEQEDMIYVLSFDGKVQANP